MEVKKALVIVPVYNEERNLDKVLSGIPKKCLDLRIDTLVVDDGSSDRTRLIIKKHHCLVLNHREKLGHGRSVRDGLDYARSKGYDFVVKLDGDGQHDTNYVSTVLKILRRGGVDHVHASRYMRKVDMVTVPPLERRLVSIMFTAIVNKVTGLNFTDGFCGFFGLNRAALAKLKLRTDGYGLPLELLIKSHLAGLRILEIPHPLIYTTDLSHCSKNDTKLEARLGNYFQVIRETLAELNIEKVYG